MFLGTQNSDNLHEQAGSKNVVHTHGELFKSRCDNVLDESIAMLLKDVDFLFLASDTIQSRLVFNALVQQSLIPGAQVGAKVSVSK